MLNILSLITLCEMLNARYKQHYCASEATAAIIPKPDNVAGKGCFCICMPFNKSSPGTSSGTVLFDHKDLEKSLNDLFSEITGILDKLVAIPETTE